MAEIIADGQLPHIPDNLTVPQFMLDSWHPTRPVSQSNPWFVEDATGRAIGFEEVRSRVYGLANALSIKFDLREDEVACIFSPNHVDYTILMWAIHRLGAVVSTASPSFNDEELAYQIQTSKATTLITHFSSLQTALAAAKVSGIPEDRVILIGTPRGADSKLSERDVETLISYGLTHDANFVERRLEPGEAKTKLALLNFSSGTTGRPKAVAIPHYALVANVIQVAVFHRLTDESIPWEERRFRPGHVALTVLPLFHIYGIIVNVMFQLYCGMTLVIVPKFDYIPFLESIVRHRVTHLWTVPPMAVLLAKHPATKKYDLRGIRYLLCGAAPVSAELQEQVVKVLPNAAIGQGYGMTETSTIISMFPISQKIGTPGSAGVLIPGIRARVVKSDGSLAKRGEQGEVYITGPSMALGYYGNEAATKETFIDGWVRTGDEVVIDDRGEVFILDRVKEFLKVRAFQVAPAELEGHLLKHPDVADACVVGVPDEYSGELPFAFVMLTADAAKRAASGGAAEIKASIAKYVADHKAKYKHLKGGVELTDVIPKTPSGKLLRRLLRDRARQLVAKRPQVSAKL
ncbi:acetyl-CoA synthetase-like protein [Gloeopeniophorella convolvens]|nr:acetyl-CoA synthetase-like protein [Gloeopeniophorella convolvens]